jgi:hypothetical protein
VEEFKVENFKRSFPASEFPPFKALNRSDCKSLLDALVVSFDIECESGMEFDNILSNRAQAVDGAKANENSFSIITILEEHGIHSRSAVYINWYRFEQVDEMKLNDLDQYWTDIWYPGPDDISVFDSSFSWILCVTHEGSVGLLRPSHS